jgi:hypothetical protein
MERTFRPVALRMSVPRWVSARLLDVLWMLLELREPPQPRRRRTFFRAGFTEALTLLAIDLDARGAPEDLYLTWSEAARAAGARVVLAGTDQARAETLDQLPPDARRRRRGGRGRARGAGHPEEGRRPLPLAEEAEAWEPQTEASPPRRHPEEQGAAAPAWIDPPPPPAPRTPSPAPATPRAPAARPAPPRPPRPEAPRSPLADDDFAAGIF